MKCLASAGGLLASGGADDLIHLYDVPVRSIHEHRSTHLPTFELITEFPHPTSARRWRR